MNLKQPADRTGLHFQIRQAKPEDKEALVSSRHPSTPDYSSRRVKIRLFALVCAAMLVLVLMFEARKPENWNWMGFEKKEADIDTRYLANIRSDGDVKRSTTSVKNLPANETAGLPSTMGIQPLDSKGDGDNLLNRNSPMSAGPINQSKSEADSGLPNSKKQTQSKKEEDESNQKDRTAGALKNENETDPNSQVIASSESELSPSEQKQVTVAEKEFWDSNYKNLNYRQRMLLLDGLYRTRSGKRLDEEQATEWLRIYEQLSNGNDRYQGDILRYLGTLEESDSRRASLTKTMFALQNRWEKFESIFLAVGNRESLDDEQLHTLSQLQERVDRTLWNFVEDNSLQSFVNDQPAMFRLAERLQTDANWREGKTAEPVLFTQLYKETDRLRGQIVSFDGTIRGAYRAAISENYLNLEHLYVFWVQLKGASNPVAVYSLEKPEGFGVDLDQYSAANPAELREKTSVTGILFQKMVYAANDGQRIAPVVFTDKPDWSPPQKVSKEENELPGLTTLVAGFLGMGAFLALLAWGFVSWQQRQHGERITKWKQRYSEASSKSDR